LKIRWGDMKNHMKKLRNHIAVVCGLLIFGIVFLSLTVNAVSTFFPWLSPESSSEQGTSSMSSAEETASQDGLMAYQYTEKAGTVDDDSMENTAGLDETAAAQSTTNEAKVVTDTDTDGLYGNSSLDETITEPISVIQSQPDSGVSSGTSSESLEPFESDSGSSDTSSQVPEAFTENDTTNDMPSSPTENVSSNSSGSDGSSHHHRSVSITGVTLNQTELQLVKGDITALTATVTPSNTTQSKTITWSSSDESVATVDSSGNVTAVDGGTATITATTVNGKTAECIVTVTVPVEAIELNSSQLSLIQGTTSAALTVSFTPDNATDQSVLWSSSDESVATVDSSGKVTAVEGGTATITATTANGKTATCMVTVSVPATGISLSLSDVPVERGKTIALTATLDPPDSTDAIMWATSDNRIATVDDSGNVTGISPGTATITAFVGDGSISASCQVTTVVSISNLYLSDTELCLKKGEEYTLTAQVLPEDTTEDRTVTWSSSDDSVATVDSTGKITAIGGGTAIITAQTGTHSAQCIVTVVVPVTGISLNQTNLVLPVHTTSSAIEVTVSPEDATDTSVSWSSSDNSIATVDETGEVTAVSAGTATITVTTNDGGFTAQCTVTVVVPVTGVHLDETELHLTKGDTDTLTAIISPEDATDKGVTWTSSDNSVVTVDDSGNMTAVGGGTATVTVTTKDGGYTDSCAVTVSVPVTGISLDRTNLTLARGATDILIPTISPHDATDTSVSWSSSDDSIATVDETGKVTAVSAGTATITATTNDGGYTAQCTVSVVVPVTGVYLNQTEMNLTKGETISLIATITPEDATEQGVTWTPSDNSVVTVDDAGNLKAVGGGTATITVTTKDGGYTDSCTVTVSVPVTGISLDRTNLTIIRGTTDILIPTISPNDATDRSVSWSSSDNSIATVDETGKVTAVSAGTATITATTHDGGFIAQCAVTVVVPVTGVTVTPSVLTLKQGTSASLSAVVLPDDATDQTISWSSSDSSIASVDSDGNVTAVNVGTATITATTNDGGYTSSCVVTVEPSTYRVTVITSRGGSVLGEGSYPAGTDVTLTAKPDPHYSFICWKDDNGSIVGVGQTYTIHNLSSDTTLKADFAPELFTVVVQAGTGGSVTGSGTYAYGTTVTIKATPDSGYEFSKWSDGSTEAERSITVTNNINLTASFRMVTEESLFRIKDYGDGTCAVIGFDSDADIPNVVIPSYIDGKKVVALQGSWGFGIFYLNDHVKTVTIPNTVTSIGEEAFINCNSITAVTIPDSVISIGRCAFYKCSSLVSVHIPDSVTSIGNLAFAYCSSLVSINVPDSVISIGNSAFEYCSSLEEITLSHSLNKIDDFMFKECTSLQSIHLPDSITEIGAYAFKNCTSLTTINIPSSVNEIGTGAFDGCISLRS
jgi:uncharacterized protein YjdB